METIYPSFFLNFDLILIHLFPFFIFGGGSGESFKETQDRVEKQRWDKKS